MPMTNALFERRWLVSGKASRNACRRRGGVAKKRFADGSSVTAANAGVDVQGESRPETARPASGAPQRPQPPRHDPAGSARWPAGALGQWRRCRRPVRRFFRQPQGLQFGRFGVELGPFLLDLFFEQPVAFSGRRQSDLSLRNRGGRIGHPAKYHTAKASQWGKPPGARSPGSRPK